ncbi:MAG: PAS domain S-box protein [Holophagaceae bacterium]|nr:PAS domain S-box protein [Holophagaceae bacterium]
MAPRPPEMLEALYVHAFQFMGVLDAGGRVLTTNPSALEIIGIGEEEVIGQPFWETPWWSHDPRAQADVKDAIAKASAGSFVRLEATHLGVDGKVRVVDFSLTPFRDGSGQVRWLFPEGRDVTDRKQAEQALRESEEKFRQIYQRSYDGILLLDGDRFVDCNPAVLEMMRCSEPELMRMHPWELSPPAQPDGRPSPEKALEMIRLAHAKGGHRFEWMHRRTDGEDFPVEVTLTPFPLSGREMLYTTWRDITDRKREERERMALERQVLHAQKLESLGILAGGIAHDFNNLMTAMMGHLDLAALELPEGHKALGHIRIMEGILGRATDLTRQMLAYSGRGRFIVGPTDLSTVAREMATLLSASLSKKVGLELELPGDLPSLEGDAAQLQQVLLNLVTNASDAIGDQPGRIRIATGLARLDSEDAAGLRAELPPRPGDYVFLEVSDTGCGIAPEFQTRIFDPFFSTKDAGRGLGLSALLGILRAHQGALGMDSVPGEGTTFRLYFPSAGRHVTAKAEAVEIQTALPPGLRVLLVDDEENIRTATRHLLESMGCQVAVAGDGVEAIEKLASSEPCSIVILDLMMPRMDGRQTLAVLQKDHPDLPVVLCSGYSEQEILGEWNGVFLAKPYTREKLKAALLRALADRS